MNEMREIGHRIKAEQNLAPEDIAWLITIAQAILRAFTWDDGRPIRTLARQLGVSPTTLYTALRLAVQALTWIRRSKASVTALKERVDQLETRLMQLESAYTATQAEVQRLTQVLAAAETQIESLQAEVGHLQAQWTVARERLIVVLKMSGRCTVRRIVEVLDYGLGIQVSVGYVQGVITQAGVNADSALDRLWAVIPLSGAICVDEVFLKELGTRIWGVVIVDPVSGLVLRLARCSERSKDALGEVLQEFAEAGFKAHIVLV